MELLSSVYNDIVDIKCDIVETARAFYKGLYDSCRFKEAWKLIWPSRTLTRLIYQCSLLNGLIFLISIVIWQLVMWAVQLILGSDNFLVAWVDWLFFVRNL